MNIWQSTCEVISSRRPLYLPSKAHASACFHTIKGREDTTCPFGVSPSDSAKRKSVHSEFIGPFAIHVVSQQLVKGTLWTFHFKKKLWKKATSLVCIQLFQLLPHYIVAFSFLPTNFVPRRLRRVFSTEFANRVIGDNDRRKRHQAHKTT